MLDSPIKVYRPSGWLLKNDMEGSVVSLLMVFQQMINRGTDLKGRSQKALLPNCR